MYAAAEITRNPADPLRCHHHHPTFITILTFAALLGAGLIAGVFFVFSAFIMQALARLETGEGDCR